jgi:hypothetical protein
MFLQGHHRADTDGTESRQVARREAGAQAQAVAATGAPRPRPDRKRGQPRACRAAAWRGAVNALSRVTGRAGRRGQGRVGFVSQMVNFSRLFCER